MYFKCTREFEVEKCDDNGFVIENEYITVEEDSIWETDSNDTDYITLYKVDDKIMCYLEIHEDLLNENFIQIKQ